MDQHAASNLANDFVRYYTALEDYGEGQADQIRKAVFLHARNLLPSVEVAIVTEHQDGLPVLLAVQQGMLVVIDAQPGKEHEPAETRRRLFALDPTSCKTEVKVRFAGSNTFGRYHRSTWTIQVDDFSVGFTGRTDEGGEMDAKALFGHRLEVALGGGSLRVMSLKQLKEESEWGGKDSNLRPTDYESSWNPSIEPNLAR